MSPMPSLRNVSTILPSDPGGTYSCELGSTEMRTGGKKTGPPGKPIAPGGTPGGTPAKAGFSKGGGRFMIPPFRMGADKSAGDVNREAITMWKNGLRTLEKVLRIFPGGGIAMRPFAAVPLSWVVTNSTSS